MYEVLGKMDVSKFTTGETYKEMRDISNYVIFEYIEREETRLKLLQIDPTPESCDKCHRSPKRLIQCVLEDRVENYCRFCYMKMLDGRK